MRANSTIVLIAASLLTCAWTADEVEVRFAKAFADGESSDKKEALRLAAALPKERDDLAYELLIKGVNDRQVHDEAVLALRARTGMHPTLNSSALGYPGYPSSDEDSGWNEWLAARKKNLEIQRKLADHSKRLKEIEKDRKKEEEAEANKGKSEGGKDGDTATKPDGQSKEDDKDGDTVAKKPKAVYEQPTDLGRQDRIVFKAGGSLVCYILSKRTNSDGILQSVRISHLDDGGEETLAIDLIARIEEDIR